MSVSKFSISGRGSFLFVPDKGIKRLLKSFDYYANLVYKTQRSAIILWLDFYLHFLPFLFYTQPKLCQDWSRTRREFVMQKLETVFVCYESRWGLRYTSPSLFPHPLNGRHRHTCEVRGPAHRVCFRQFAALLAQGLPLCNSDGASKVDLDCE